MLEGSRNFHWYFLDALPADMQGAVCFLFYSMSTLGIMVIHIMAQNHLFIWTDLLPTWSLEKLVET